MKCSILVKLPLAGKIIARIPKMNSMFIKFLGEERTNKGVNKNKIDTNGIYQYTITVYPKHKEIKILLNVYTPSIGR